MRIECPRCGEKVFKDETVCPHCGCRYFDFTNFDPYTTPFYVIMKLPLYDETSRKLGTGIITQSVKLSTNSKVRYEQVEPPKLLSKNKYMLWQPKFNSETSIYLVGVPDEKGVLFTLQVPGDDI